MINLKLSPSPSPVEYEHIRQLVGFYRGIASFSGSNLITIQPKEDFNLDGLLHTFASLHYEVKIL